MSIIRARNAIQPVPLSNQIDLFADLELSLHTPRAKEARDKRLPVSLVVVAVATDSDTLPEDIAASMLQKE